MTEKWQRDYARLQQSNIFQFLYVSRTFENTEALSLSLLICSNKPLLFNSKFEKVPISLHYLNFAWLGL